MRRKVGSASWHSSTPAAAGALAVLALGLAGCQSRSPGPAAGDRGVKPGQASVAAPAAILAAPDQLSGATHQPPHAHGSFTPIPITSADVADAVSSDPDDFNLRMEAAGYYMQHGLFRDAADDLRPAVRIRPASMAARIALGDALSSEGKDGEAARVYQQVLEISPSNPLAYRGWGQLLIEQRRFSQAEKIMGEGLKKNPTSADLQIALGNLYLVLRRNTEAETLLRSAVQQRPGEADIHYLLALAYERNLHVKAALGEAQKAVALDPSLADAWASVGLYLVTLERYRDARPPLLNAIRLSPRTALYYQVLGDSYAKDLSSPDNAGKAMELYRHALTLDPNNVLALIALGTALGNRDLPADRVEAVPVLKRVIEIRPHDKEPYYRLSEILREMGHTKEAAAYLQQFRAIAMNDERQKKKIRP